MKILKNIIYLVVPLLLARISYGFFGDIFFSVFPNERGGSWVDTMDLGNLVIGFPTSYLFFLFLLFTAFGDQHKKWWIGIASIPALAFLLYFDFSHIYFHLLFPLAGWLIGWGIGKLLHPNSLSRPTAK